jgi:hypothetical protein
MRLAKVAAVLDIGCVVIFVVIGRASHVKGESLAGIASTSWPFLCGLGAGWAAARVWRRPLRIRREGITVWLCTVAAGMVLRVVSGQGTAAAFIVVALLFLGLFLLGWRLAGQLAARLAGLRRASGGGEHRGREAAAGGLRASGVEAAGHGGDLR